jgi:hypothetical protein
MSVLDLLRAQSVPPAPGSRQPICTLHFTWGFRASRLGECGHAVSQSVHMKRPYSSPSFEVPATDDTAGLRLPGCPAPTSSACTYLVPPAIRPLYYWHAPGAAYTYDCHRQLLPPLPATPAPPPPWQKKVLWRAHHGTRLQPQAPPSLLPPTLHMAPHYGVGPGVLPRRAMVEPA